MSRICLMARDRRAATGLEYVLIASMLAVAIAFVATSVDVDTSGLASVFSQAVSRI